MSRGLTALSSRANCRRNRAACAAWIPALEPVSKNRCRPLCRNRLIMHAKVACNVSRYNQLRLLRAHTVLKLVTPFASSVRCAHVYILHRPKARHALGLEDLHGVGLELVVAG